MPSKKRARPTSGVDDGAAHPKPFSLERYHLLPLELRHHIISFACLHPTPGTPSALTPFATDSATILNLCLVSRELRQLVQHRLYRDVTVTRPSKLYALQQALVERPEMGRMIERLHVGPQDILPPHWWPLSHAYLDGYSYESPRGDESAAPLNWLATSLKESELPSGCKDRQAFALKCSLEGSCRDIAITRAIETAENHLQATLQQGPPFHARYARVGPVLEVQAALDLYLSEIRAIEDGNPHYARLATRDTRVPQRCRDGKCDHYPSLTLQATRLPVTPEPAQTAPTGAYTLSRTQLLRHMARPGGVIDRFDHPLLFSRSRLKIHLAVPPGKGHRDYVPNGPGARYVLLNQFPDAAGGYSLHEWHDASMLSSEDQMSYGRPLNTALLNTATIVANLRLARMVLALTPNLTGLSLTGFLESAVGGWMNPRLPSLRRLSLGPPPVCWDAGLALKGLQSVEDLRVAGTALVAAEIEVIRSTKPKLRSIEWSMKEPLPSEMELNIAQTLDLLLQSDTSSTDGDTASADAPGEDGEDVNDAQTEGDFLPSLITKRVSRPAPPSRAQVKPPLVVTARLHPANVALVLASAPSEEVKAAWLAEGEGGGGGDSAGGRTARAPRLRLRENSAPKSGETSTLQPSKDSTSRVWGEFYEEAREWWARGGGA